ncbi:MAG: hypothetical protein HY360_14360 [Verrucomicrobia bacterium]|nr:hypothetical protein [Verrucomicrobiota bacterium]
MNVEGFDVPKVDNIYRPAPAKSQGDELLKRRLSPEEFQRMRQETLKLAAEHARDSRAPKDKKLLKQERLRRGALLKTVSPAYRRTVKWMRMAAKAKGEKRVSLLRKRDKAYADESLACMKISLRTIKDKARRAGIRKIRKAFRRAGKRNKAFDPDAQKIALVSRELGPSRANKLSEQDWIELLSADTRKITPILRRLNPQLEHAQEKKLLAILTAKTDGAPDEKNAVREGTMRLWLKRLRDLGDALPS